MDAFVRNKCEQEILHIINEISKELKIQIKVETEAFDEGGLTEYYSFFATAEGQAILSLSEIILVIIGIVLTRVPSRKSKLDREEQRLSIEEKKLNIEILKKELEEKKIEIPSLNIENIEYVTINNIKIRKHKSNFYKSLKQYPKVNKVSVTKLNTNRKPIENPLITERRDFGNFILESDILEPLTDENASLEIISPVLKKGKYKWKGIYDKTLKPIDFSMKDRDFRENVVSNSVPFKNGAFIDCILEIERKIDDLGLIYNSNYSVITVLKHYEDGISFETPQGKKHRQKKEADKMQLRLFDDNNNE